MLICEKYTLLKSLKENLKKMMLSNIILTGNIKVSEALLKLRVLDFLFTLE